MLRRLFCECFPTTQPVTCPTATSHIIPFRFKFQLTARPSASHNVFFVYTLAVSRSNEHPARNIPPHPFALRHTPTPLTKLQCIRYINSCCLKIEQTTHLVAIHFCGFHRNPTTVHQATMYPSCQLPLFQDRANGPPRYNVFIASDPAVSNSSKLCTRPMYFL